MTDDDPKDAIQRGHEPFELSATAVAKGFTALYALVIVSLLLMAGLMVTLAKFMGGDATVDAPAEFVDAAPGVPTLDSNQNVSLRALRSQERKVLTEYAWIDAQAGVARIPIKRAMEILSQTAPNTPQAPKDATVNP